MVMEMVVEMVVGNPLFGGFRTNFRYCIFLRMILTYVDLARKWFWWSR